MIVTKEKPTILCRPTIFGHCNNNLISWLRYISIRHWQCLNNINRYINSVLQVCCLWQNPWKFEMFTESGQIDWYDTCRSNWGLEEAASLLVWFDSMQVVVFILMVTMHFFQEPIPGWLTTKTSSRLKKTGLLAVLGHCSARDIQYKVTLLFAQTGRHKSVKASLFRHQGDRLWWYKILHLPLI